MTAVWIGRVWVYARSFNPSDSRESRFRDAYGTGFVSQANGSSAGARDVEERRDATGRAIDRRECGRPTGRRLRGGWCLSVVLEFKLSSG